MAPLNKGYLHINSLLIFNSDAVTTSCQELLFVVDRKPVRLRKDEIERLSRQIGAQLKSKNVIQLKVGEGALLQKVIDVITHDLAQEDKVDEDARKLINKYRSQIDSGMMDERQVFQMIKKQLAKERKLVL